MSIKHISFAFVLFFIPVVALAQTVVRVGDGLTIESDQTVTGDYYVSVGPVGTTVMSGTITEDMYAFGGTVTVNGTVGKDLGVIGGVAQIHASVADDARVVAGETIIAEDIGGDLFVLSGKLQVLSTATIAGDIIFYGGDAEINGAVAGSIHGAAQNMRIDAPVGGDIDIQTHGGLTLGSRAQVQGDIIYSSTSEIIRAQDAQVEGSIVQKDTVDDTARANAQDILVPFFITLFATLTFYLLFRRHLYALVLRIEGSYAKTGLVGLAALILGPILALLLMITVLGFLVGLFVLTLTAMVYIVSIALSSVLLGAALAKAVTKKTQVSLLWILLGACVLQVCLYIPLLGGVLFFALMALVAGGVVLSIYKTLS